MKKTNAPALRPIDTVGEAQHIIAHLNQIMDALIATIEEETAHVRAGRLGAATTLEEKKGELARAYASDTGRLAASKQFIASSLPEALDALRSRHNTFNALLQINLTVLATAHAVSEGIIRGVSGELARQRAPQTYGASGKANALPPKASQPIAICRSL